MTTTFKSLWRKLRDKTYREWFVAAEVKRGIPFQMRALLKKSGWTQRQLAQRAGITQGVVSRALNPNYGDLTLNTIIRIAAGFDVAFVGTFVPFSELVRKHETLSEERSGDVTPFAVEDERHADEADVPISDSASDVSPFKALPRRTRPVKIESLDSRRSHEVIIADDTARSAQLATRF